MARVDLLNMLYSQKKSVDDFDFFRLTAPPLYSLLSQYDVKTLHDIAVDPRLTSKVEKKYDYIKEIMSARGFIRFAGGTNRVVYRFKEDQSFVAKIGIDKYGITDSPAEMRNQWHLQPFVTRMFEHSPCGTVGIAERVEPITSLAQFMSIAPDVFEMLTKKVLGKYVLEDIGSLYFKNYGVRMVNPQTRSMYAFGPVLLDYPYMYELDGEKLFCNTRDQFTGELCGGQIDYDNGFNNLVCEKCGRIIHACDIEKKINNNVVIAVGRRKETGSMKVEGYYGDTKVVETDTTKTVKSYAELSSMRKEEAGIKPKKNASHLSVTIPAGYEQKLKEAPKNREELNKKIADEIKSMGAIPISSLREHTKNKVEQRQCAPYSRAEEESAEQSSSIQETIEELNESLENEQGEELCPEVEEELELDPIPSDMYEEYPPDYTQPESEEEDYDIPTPVSEPQTYRNQPSAAPRKQTYEETHNKKGYPASKGKKRNDAFDDMGEY